MKQLPEGFGQWGLKRQIQWLSSLPEFKESAEAQQLATQLLELAESNPLLLFEPHSDAQRKFLCALTAIVAAFAGNRFGKTTILVISGLREALPPEFLPPLLRETKRFEGATHGWIVCPTEDKIFEPGGFKDTIEKWVPKRALAGGSWKRAFNGQHLTLRFECGSSIGFKTYKQDPADLGSASLHWAGFDEPPPRKHREEVRMRLADHGGFEMFAMTPLQTNTGYVRREIWKKREAPHITVVKGSIHDNPTLNKETVNLILGDLSDLWRRAREFGDFIDVGGQIYPDFERCVQEKPFDPGFVRGLDVVVGIDPGIRNAGLVWVGFDSENVAHVFDEGLLQDRTAADYVSFIRETNQRWGLRNVQYVIDPAAKQRAQANGMTVLSELNDLGVYPNLGQNDHELGFGQMRTRMQHGRFKVSPSCVRLRDQADDYAAKEPEEGKDDSKLEPIKGNDHILDALRYAVLERFWDRQMEETAPGRVLGWQPGRALPAESLRVPQETHPMGFLS